MRKALAQFVNVLLFCFLNLLNSNAQQFSERYPNLDKWQEFPRWTPQTQPGSGLGKYRLDVSPNGIVQVIGLGETTTGKSNLNYYDNRFEKRTASGFSELFIVDAEVSPGDFDLAIVQSGSSEGETHLMWQKSPDNISTYLMYRKKDWNGLSSIQQIAGSKDYSLSEIATDPLGNVHFLGVNELGEVIYWENPQSGGAQKNFGKGTAIGIAADSFGNVYVTWHSTDPTNPLETIIFFCKRIGAIWGTSEEVAKGDDAEDDGGDVAADNGGNAHVVLHASPGIIKYKFRSATGTWGNIEEVSTINVPDWLGNPKIVVDSRRQPHILWENEQLPAHVVSYAVKIQGATWSRQEPIGEPVFESDVNDVAISSTSDQLHWITRYYGWYCHSFEPNLGAQDPALTIPWGPNMSMNVATGNVHFELTLFSCLGFAFPNNLSLIYNSLDPDKSVISPGWMHNYHMTVTLARSAHPFELGASYILKLYDGREIVFRAREVGPNDVRGIADDDYGYFSQITRESPQNNSGGFTLTTKYGIRYIFDPMGRLKMIKDTMMPTPNSMTFDYETNNGETFLRFITDGTGRKTELQYDAQNRLLKVIDPANGVYDLVYETVPGDPELGKLSQVKFSSGTPVSIWKFEYHSTNDANIEAKKGFLAKVYTPRGQADIDPYYWKFVYWPDGRARRSTEPSVNSIIDETKIDAIPVPINGENRITYVDPIPPFDVPNTSGNVPKAIITNRRGFNTKIEYEYKRCLADKITDAQQPTNGITRRYFDGYDFINPTSSVPHYRNLIRTKDERGSIYEYSYHTTAVPAHVKDNLKEVFRPKGDTPTDPPDFLPPIVTEYTQDGFNNVKTYTDSKGNATTYFYYPNGNLQRIDYPKVTLPDGSFQDAFDEFTLYDDRGRIKSAKNANGCVTTYEYNDDVTGLVTSIQRPGNSLKDEFTYYPMGYTHTSKPAGMGVTTNEINGLYQLKSVTEPVINGAIPKTSYEYDEDGNTKQIIAPKITTTNTYDRLGRLKTSSNPKQGSLRWEYDRSGAERLSADYNTPTGKHSQRTLYDELGRVSKSQTYVKNPDDANSPEWTTTEMKYLPDGLVESVKSENLKTSFEYNARDLRTKVTHPIASIKDFYCYDDNDNQTRYVRRDDSKAKPFQYGSISDFDERNRLRRSTQIKSDPGIDLCDPNITITGVTTKYLRDANGNVTKTVDPEGNETSMIPDCQDRMKDFKDGNGILTSSMIRDDAKRTVETRRVNPATGQITSGPPPLEKFSVSYYGENGLLEKTEDALGYFTTYEYDVNGNRVLTTDAKGIKYRTILNELDQVVKEIKDEGGLNITTEYKERDSNGNVTLLVDANKKEYKFAYDRADRKTKTSYPDNTDERTAYDALGRVKMQNDRANKVTDFLYDNESRLTSETHGATTITYSDHTGFRVPKVVDDGKVRTEDNYDELGRKMKSSWFIDNQPFKSVSYEYYDNGLRKLFKDGEGKNTNYTYNPNNQLETLTWDGKPYTTFNYYLSGLQKDITYHLVQDSKTIKTYNKRHDLMNIKTVKANNDLIASYTYDYDPLGNRTFQQMDHIGGKVNYKYDNISRLQSEEWFGGNNPNYWAKYDYDDNGNRKLKETCFGRSDYEFNDVNELTVEHKLTIGDFKLLSPVAVTASSTKAGYDAFTAIDGNINNGMTPSTSWRSEKASNEHSLTVDLGAAKLVAKLRLFFPVSVDPPKLFKIQVSEDGTVFEDISCAEAIGAFKEENSPDWWSVVKSEITFTFVPKYARYVRLVQAPHGGGVKDPDVAWMNEFEVYSGVQLNTDITYNYDDNGNLKSKVEGGVTDTYTHDQLNRMVGYENTNNNKKYSYLFTPTGGLRMRKTNELASPQEHELYMYDDDNKCNDYVAQGNGQPQLKKSYQQELSIDNKLGYFSKDDNTFHFYSRDAIGTNRNQIDEGNQKDQEFFSNAWGEKFGEKNAEFQQREYDEESGLYYYRNRMLDPSIGRFIQDDPTNPIADHYGFASNNPVNRIDPMGLQDEEARKVREYLKKFETAPWVETRSGHDPNYIIPTPSFVKPNLGSDVDWEYDLGIESLNPEYAARIYQKAIRDFELKNGYTWTPSIELGRYRWTEEDEKNYQSWLASATAAKEAELLYNLKIAREFDFFRFLSGTGEDLERQYENKLNAFHSGGLSAVEQIEEYEYETGPLMMLNAFVRTADLGIAGFAPSAPTVTRITFEPRIFSTRSLPIKSGMSSVSKVEIMEVNGAFARSYAKVPKVAALVRKIWGSNCVYCGSKASTIDHIIAWIRGGKTTVVNGVPACRSCNSAKNAMYIRGLYRSLNRLRRIMQDW